MIGGGRPSETVFVGPADHRVRRSCSGQVARFRRYRFGEEPEEHRPKTEADQIVQLLAERVGREGARDHHGFDAGACGADGLWLRRLGTASAQVLARALGRGGVTG